MSKILTPKEIIKLAMKHSKGQFCVRDELIIALVGISYFNATELSLVRVADLITERGGITEEGWLPPNFSHNDFERYYAIGKNTYLGNCIKRYIKWRKDNGFGCLDRELYCGLDPNSYLILKDDGESFKMNYRDRKNDPTQTQPSQMQRHFQEYYLGEGVSIPTLLDSCIINVWNVKSQQGQAQAIKDLTHFTGQTKETLRKKCIRKQESIKNVLVDIYRA